MEELKSTTTPQIFGHTTLWNVVCSWQLLFSYYLQMSTWEPELAIRDFQVFKKNAFEVCEVSNRRMRFIS